MPRGNNPKTEKANGSHLGFEATLLATADSFLRDLRKSLKADYILANPPFNIGDWAGDRLRTTRAGNSGRRPSATPITPG